MARSLGEPLLSAAFEINTVAGDRERLNPSVIRWDAVAKEQEYCLRAASPFAAGIT